jgi:hypothetical protein
MIGVIDQRAPGLQRNGEGNDAVVPRDCTVCDTCLRRWGPPATVEDLSEADRAFARATAERGTDGGDRCETVAHLAVRWNSGD